MIDMICLMPTYGRRKALLEESIACFQQQEYENKYLLIYDDLGTLVNTKTIKHNIHIIASNTREPSVGAKYNRMLQFIKESGLYGSERTTLQRAGLVVWDDDDIYLPKHIAHHAEILDLEHWSKPSKIISAYFNPPQEEDARGRFHGSIALQYSFAKRVGGWIDTTRATFDQEFLQRLEHHSIPGDPCRLGEPTYIYRWQTSQSGHCSGLMGSPNWYQEYKPDSLTPIDTL